MTDVLDPALQRILHEGMAETRAIERQRCVAIAELHLKLAYQLAAPELLAMVIAAIKREDAK